MRVEPRQAGEGERAVLKADIGGNVMTWNVVAAALLVLTLVLAACGLTRPESIVSTSAVTAAPRVTAPVPTMTVAAATSTAVALARPGGAVPTTMAPVAPTPLAPTPMSTGPLLPAELAARLSWQPTSTPANGDVDGAEWLEIRFRSATLGERRQVAAVFRPVGDGPFPVVIYLHGSSGLTRTMLNWAPRLTQAGFVVLAGCYTLTTPSRTNISCPEGPLAEDGVAALVEVAQRLPGAKPHAVGVLGLSAGAQETYWFLHTHPRDIAAAVGDSGTANATVIRNVAAVESPVLLLAGLKDRQTNIASVQEFERALAAAGKVVDAEYYAEGEHVVSLSEPTANDATQRIVDFFHHYLS